MTNPLLRRDIQFIPTEIDGKQMIMIMDPLNLTKNGVALDRGIIPLLQMLDGNHNFRDIQMVLMRQSGGTLIPLSEIEAFIHQLDDIFLLESDRLHEHVTALYEEFNRQPNRSPSHAGKSYDMDPDKFSRFIENTEQELLQDTPDYSEKTISGLLAPHIDISIAAKTYVDLYRRLRGKTYDLVIIFGINHQWQDGLYSISPKNFITPFGVLQTDRDFITELNQRVPEGTLATNDFGHRTEHSIEFQTVFLHYYLRSSPPLIIPILCGGIHEFIFQKRNVLTDERFLAMGEALTNLINEGNKNVLFVAGVDFSHIGLKFGHQTPASSMIHPARTNDQKIIDELEAGNPETIFDNAVENQDHFHVCGLPSILIFSHLLKNHSGTLLAHETYDEQATKSAVTYASMIFTKG